MIGSYVGYLGAWTFGGGDRASMEHQPLMGGRVWRKPLLFLHSGSAASSASRPRP